MSNTYNFSLQSVWVAAPIGGGLYGTPYQLESSKTLKIVQKIMSDKAQGNSRTSALAGQSLGDFDLNLGTAGFDQEALEIFLGTTQTASNDGSSTKFGNQLQPYFGLLAQSYVSDPDNPTANTADILFWFPNAMITADWSYSLEFMKISVPEFKCNAIQIGSFYDYAMWMLERPDGGEISFPPIIPA